MSISCYNPYVSQPNSITRWKIRVIYICVCVWMCVCVKGLSISASRDQQRIERSVLVCWGVQKGPGRNWMCGLYWWSWGSRSHHDGTRDRSGTAASWRQRIRGVPGSEIIHLYGFWTGFLNSTGIGVLRRWSPRHRPGVPPKEPLQTKLNDRDDRSHWHKQITHQEHKSKVAANLCSVT